MKAGLISLFIVSVFAAGCGSNGASGTSEPGTTCSTTQLEAAMDTVLAQTFSEVDFSFSVERQDGRRYNFNRGVSTLQTSYESASTSKLVSAVINSATGRTGLFKPLGPAAGSYRHLAHRQQ
jgi:hypothetical protein